MEEKRPGYYEGILQLRNPTKKIKEFVDKFLKENKVYIASRNRISNGVDMKVSSNKLLLKLGKMLKSRFRGNLKVSRKLFSQDRLTGKKIWRMTVFFSHYDLKIGQKVKIRGEEYKIKRLGDKVHCTAISTGKKKFFDYKEIQ